MRDEDEGKYRGGRREDPCEHDLVQKVAQGKTPYGLSWRVQAIIIDVDLMCPMCAKFRLRGEPSVKVDSLSTSGVWTRFSPHGHHESSQSSPPVVTRG